MSNHLVELHDVEKSYKKMMALRGVSFQMDVGITGLLGPNGAGKSTLIKVLMGLVSVNRGHGTILGHPLGAHGRKVREVVGYMPEDDCYITGMTGIEMVRFSAQLAGLPPIEALRRSHEILDFCGVHQERYRSVEGYSTGMRQKIKFAAAIVHDPVLLILDEPTSGLDPEEREALLNRIRVLCEKFNKSALISTHILPDVQQICDNVIILSQGQVRVSDKLETLNKPASSKYIASVLNDANLFCELLNKHQIHAEMQDDGTVALMVNSESVFPTIWKLCEDHSIILRSLGQTRNSIEEIFMAAIKEDHNADS